MADPEAEFALYLILEEGNNLEEVGRLDFVSPFYDFGWDRKFSVQDYVNRVAPHMAEMLAFGLGIHVDQRDFHIHVPLHPSYQFLQDLAPPRLTPEEEWAQILRYAFPGRNIELNRPPTPPVPESPNQVFYVGIGVVCVVSMITLARFR